MGVATSILVSVVGTALLGRKEGIDAEVVYDLGLLTIIGSVVGSRGEYVRTHWAERFAAHPLEAFDIREGGYVFFGGLLLAVALDVAYLLWKRVPIGPLADWGAAFIALGLGISRIGCFSAGCCYGKPTDLPWAVTFPEGAIAPAGIPLHPTQLYESAFSFALAAFLFWWRAKKRRFAGEGLLLFGILYPAWRFTNEFLRGDGERGWAIVGVLTNGQATSLLIASMAAGAFAWHRWGHKR